MSDRIQSASALTHSGNAAELTQNPPLKDARTLARLVLEAYGGEQKLRELEKVTFRGTGKIFEYSSLSSAHNSFACKMLSKGNKLRIEMMIMGQPIITAYNGTTGWSQQGEEVFPADPLTLQRIAGEVEHSLDHQLLGLAEPDTQCTLMPDATVNGDNCDVLDVQPENGHKYRLFCDKKSHLVLRAEFKGVDSEQGIEATMANEYADYHPQFGSQEPFRIVEYTNGHRTSEAVEDTSEIDEHVSDAVFEMPAEKRMARLQQGPVTIPFQFAYNQVLIHAKANGKDCVFILDTGASQSMLAESEASQLGALHPSEYSVTTGGGAMKLGFMVLKDLSLGDVTLNDVSIGVTDGSALQTMRGVHPSGLLGANVLKRFLLSIDYGTHQITFSDPHTVAVPADAMVIPTKPAMGNLGIVVDGTIDDKLTIPLLVDTGAAFNNISSDLVKPIFSDKLLPVSKILGLDGQQIDIGAVQFNKLEIGPLVFDKPVFSIANDSQASPGIITSKTLAILGNPFWKRFKVTIDYRNNRIFLEKSAPQQALMNLDVTLDQIEKTLHTDSDYEHAIKSCSDLLQSDDAKRFTSVAALIQAELGSILMEKAIKTKSMEFVSQSKDAFTAADKLARQAGDESVTARVFAKLARGVADNDLSLDRSIRDMLEQAVALAPMEPEVLTSAALLFKKDNPTFAAKAVDQALSVDPANWDALWLRYRLASDLGQIEERRLVVKQLAQYYPEAPEVLKLKEQVEHHANDAAGGGTKHDTTKSGG